MTEYSLWAYGLPTVKIWWPLSELCDHGIRGPPSISHTIVNFSNVIFCFRVLLQHLNSNWGTTGSQLDKAMLKETVKAFTLTNEDLQKKGKNDVSCDVACKVSHNCHISPLTFMGNVGIASDFLYQYHGNNFWSLSIYIKMYRNILKDFYNVHKEVKFN